MFWRKKVIPIEKDSSIHQLAGQLGIERRRAMRVRYPQADTRLPQASVRGNSFSLLDISTGGCCALDPSEFLGTKVGIKAEITLKWSDGLQTDVRVRLVARVDQRVHIQFLDLNPTREDQIRNLVVPGARGTSVKRHSIEGEAAGLQIVARELWGSPYGDSVTIEDDIHRLGRVTLFGVDYTLIKDAWPVKNGNIPLSPDEVADLALFLCNIPAPSDWLKALSTHIELHVRESRGGK